MLPKTIALIDDDREYSEFLGQYLENQGASVRVYDDSGELLADAEAFGYDFYVIDLMLPGVDGIEMLKILRRRSDVGVLVVSGRLGPEVFKAVIHAGADMYLAKPVQFEQVALAIQAVQRRAGKHNPSVAAWRLERRLGELVAPDGARVALSETDRAVLECFIEAQGAPVTRDTLNTRLGRQMEGDGDDGLNATIYRLRRRIEKATTSMVPLQSKSRVGYVFRAPLMVT